MEYSIQQETSSFLERYANGEYLDGSPVPSFADNPSFTYLKPPEPRNERERLQVVLECDPYETPSIRFFADKTRAKLGIVADLAKSTFQVDSVIITLIDDRSLRIKASRDFLTDIPSRADSFCAHALLRNGTEPIVVPDTRKDWRFANHPLTQACYRFWSGAPLRTESGHNIGALSLFSKTPRTNFDSAEAQKQMYMALIVIREFECYRESRLLAQSGRWQKAISHFSQQSALCKSSQEIFELATDDIAKGLELGIVFIVEISGAGDKPTFYLQSSVGLDVPQVAEDKASREPKRRKAESSKKKARVTGASLLHALSIAKSNQGHAVIISEDELDMIPKPTDVTALFSEDGTINYPEGSRSGDCTTTFSPVDPSTLSEFSYGARTSLQKNAFAIGAYTKYPNKIVSDDHLQFLVDFGIAFRTALKLCRTQTILRISEKKLRKERDLLNTLLQNILPPAFTEKLIEGTRAIAETYSSCTIIFADLVNFTHLSSRLSARDTVVLLNRLFCRFDLIAAHLGIEKIKTIGDCYMAGAGFPEPNEDHARVVAEFALAIKATVRDFNMSHDDNLQFRIGFNSGPSMAGVIGRTKFVYDIWGNTVNIAKRLETASEPDHINVGQTSYKLLKDFYRFETRGFVAVKGVGNCAMYYLTGRIQDNVSESGRPAEEELAEMFRDSDAEGISEISHTVKVLSETLKAWDWGSTPSPSPSPSGSPELQPLPSLPLSVPRDLGHAQMVAEGSTCSNRLKRDSVSSDRR